MAVDLLTILFEQVLRISPALISQYSTIQDKLLYLVLIPHVVLLIFIIGFGRGFVGRFVEHRGLQWLVTIVLYIYFIWGGWYGSFMIPLFTTFFSIALMVGLAIFFMYFVFHPARAPAVGHLMKEAGKLLVKKGVEPGEIQREIDRIDRQINILTHSMTGTTDTMTRRAYELQILQLQTQKSELQSKLHH